MSVLERVAIQYFQKRSQARPVTEPADAVHYLNPEERAALWRIERGAVIRAAIAGALSATASAIAEVYASPLLPEGESMFSMGGLKFWAVLGGVTVVASVLEIFYLYWDTLKATHELARAAGLDLFKGVPEKNAVAEALARAALELPNPPDSNWRINPRREASKVRLLAVSLVYKLKVGITSFLMKLLVRKILGRAMVRSVANAMLPFVAVPITAIWNAIVTYRVLQEARLRAMGPSAANELLGLTFSDAPPLSAEGKLAAVRAVAVAIVRTEDLHPNLLAVLHAVSERVGDTGSAELDDPGEFLRSLGGLTEAERRVALQVLAIACVVDGRLSSREKKLLEQALGAAGRSMDLSKIDALRKSFAAGDNLSDEALRAI